MQDFGEYASWANWTVGEVTDATLGVESTAASPAAAPLPTPLLRERNLAVQFVAVVMAAASTVAIALVGTLSIGCHAAVMLVAKIGPLRTLYEALSGAYDRLLDQLAQKVLRDPRDTPALRLMIAITFSVLPIFLVQLVLKKPSLLLVAVFYLSLYGIRFQRFVRIFSVKHLEAHRPQGYFSGIYGKIFGRYVEFFLGYLYGNIPELDRTVHVRLHHRENSGFEDNRFHAEYDRTSRLDFFRYLSGNVWTVLGIEPYLYFKARGDEANCRRLLWGMGRYVIFFTALSIYEWRIGLLFALVPLLCINFITAMIAWVQHAFYDTRSPNDYFANTVTLCDEVNFMNEGYHLAHHHRCGLHWTELPAHHERLRDKMRASGSLIFRDLDFIGLFLELTLIRRMDVLAEKLVPWEPLTHEERLALLAKRTNPATNRLGTTRAVHPALI